MAFIIQMVLLITALSTDTLIASFAYGTEKIRIPLKASLCIVLLGTLLLALSLISGRFLMKILPTSVLSNVCFILLFTMGIWKCASCFFKNWLKHKSGKTVDIHKNEYHIMFKIYLDYKEADQDHSKSLSLKEAISLGCALSFDSLATGIGIAATFNQMILLLFFYSIIQLLALKVGEKSGLFLSSKVSSSLTWISGIFLIVLAFFKL